MKISDSRCIFSVQGESGAYIAVKRIFAFLTPLSAIWLSSYTMQSSGGVSSICAALRYISGSSFPLPTDVDDIMQSIYFDIPRRTSAALQSGRGQFVAIAVFMPFFFSLCRYSRAPSIGCTVVIYFISPAMHHERRALFMFISL